MHENKSIFGDDILDCSDFHWIKARLCVRRNKSISIFEVNKPSHDCVNSRFLFTEDGIDVILQQNPIQGSNNLNVIVQNYDISE